MTINKPVVKTAPTWEVVFAVPEECYHPLGESTVALTEAELDKYNADCDGYAAARFDVSKADYLDWHRFEGNALCSAETRHGKPCGNVVGWRINTAQAWLAKHRKAFCSAHGGQTKRS
jgi:hypothetical protein